MKLMKDNMTVITSAFLLLLSTFGVAQEEPAAAEGELIINEANSLDELLDNVKGRRVVENREHTDREGRFAREKVNQAQMLKDAEAERRREERRSDRLETTFEENEIRIGDMTEQLDKRLGSLRELFGVLQQVAGDTRGLFEASLISSQYANRGEWLGELAAKMGTSSQLATIDEMEELWFEMQREMTESGKISKYPGTITISLLGIAMAPLVAFINPLNTTNDTGFPLTPFMAGFLLISQSILMLLFGIDDLHSFHSGQISYQQRIAKHVYRVMTAAGAAVTAVFIVHLGPAFADNDQLLWALYIIPPTIFALLTSFILSKHRLSKE